MIKINKEKIVSFLKENKFVLICFAIVLIFLGNLVRLEFSRCTFRMYTTPYTVEYEHYLVIGRYIVALFWKLVNILNFSLYQTYFTSFVIGIVSITLSIYLLFKLLKENVRNNALNICISTGIILNCFLIDYYIYIEKGIFSLSILLAVLAVYQLVKFFKESKKRNLLFSLIFLCISVFSYQGTAALFIAIAVIYIIKYSDNIKKFIINNVITASIYGIAMGSAYFLVRIIGGESTSRTTGNLLIFESLKKIIKGMRSVLVYSCGIMPKYFFLITFAIVFAFVIFLILKSEKNKRNKILSLFGYIYILVACTIASLLPQFVIDTSAIDLSARAIYPFASIIALSVAYIFVNLDLTLNTKKIFLVILIIFMLVQCYEYNAIIIDHYALNYAEKQLAFNIGTEIEKYEKANNIEIKYIIFYNDKNSSYSYKDLKSYGDINERVFKTTWCRINILNYYLNRSFTQKFELNEEYEKYYENVDYESFNVDELKFENDTLHLCIY